MRFITLVCSIGIILNNISGFLYVVVELYLTEQPDPCHTNALHVMGGISVSVKSSLSANWVYQPGTVLAPRPIQLE